MDRAVEGQGDDGVTGFVVCGGRVEGKRCFGGHASIGSRRLEMRKPSRCIGRAWGLSLSYLLGTSGASNRGVAVGEKSVRPVVFPLFHSLARGAS